MAIELQANPLVLLIHGWPECWPLALQTRALGLLGVLEGSLSFVDRFSWRWQLPALAKAHEPFQTRVLCSEIGGSFPRTFAARKGGCYAFLHGQAGYYAVAPDMPGYGGSDSPKEVLRCSYSK